jgi:transcriptional regulator with XRE-family HTH domain
MTMSKRLRAMLDQARTTDSYWVEHAKLAFGIALDRQRRRADLSGKDIAQRIGSSQPYVSKVFRGDSNFTIETMVKLARATGGELKLDIHPMDAIKIGDWILQPYVPDLKSFTATSETTVLPRAANQDAFRWTEAA